MVSIWKEYFEDLMNQENDRKRSAVVVDHEVKAFSEEEVRTAMKRMKRAKAVGPDNIPLEAWLYLGGGDLLSEVVQQDTGGNENT